MRAAGTQEAGLLRRVRSDPLHLLPWGAARLGPGTAGRGFNQSPGNEPLPCIARRCSAPVRAAPQTTPRWPILGPCWADPPTPLASLSCAISCVSTMPRSTSQMVQVVSIELVPMRRGSSSFQSKEVRGAANSPPLFCRGRPGGMNRRAAQPRIPAGQRGALSTAGVRQPVQTVCLMSRVPS